MNRTASRLGLAATILNLIGLGLATYLTIEHFSTTPSYACPESSVINCMKVTTSSYSKFAGVPVALAGLLYFVVSIPVHLPASWRSKNPWFARLRYALAVIGMASVFYLIYGELELGAICLYCTGVHVVTFALLAITFIGSALVSSHDQQVGEVH